ncbi:hypothetical protein L2737_13115 [Shewanella electrodiphila]|uniref:Uncharacterized protein n=1 Tax=Shewanella electrodiphila TaxID=934143 RepID=A0ABT0KQX9_9GAMM|nr:hypothetical protein [Shewanella electrodiphila]MCL1046257.1 hypothetical protein [Shewanella electrodiphila]
MNEVRKFKSALDIFKVVNWVIVILILAVGIIGASGNPIAVVFAVLGAGIFYILINLVLGVGYCAVQIAENTATGETISSTPKVKEKVAAKITKKGKLKLDMSLQCKHEGCYERTYSTYDDNPLCAKHAPE